MDSPLTGHAQPEANKSRVEINSRKISIGEVFAEQQLSYLNEFTLYLAHFNSIPNFIHEVGINCKKANQWFATAYHEHISDRHFNKRYFKRSKQAEYDDIFYLLHEDLMVDFDTNQSVVRFLFRKTPISAIESIIAGLKKFNERKGKRKPELSILVKTNTGIDTKSLRISKPKLNMGDNYNDDFREIHETIIKRLSRKNDKGLVLLHGKPGTGKTSYIRFLIASVKKNVIFLPPDMAGAITHPNLISILIDNPNSILVIEDAEKIIVDRDKDDSSPVSGLLNICDGLLSDCLNIQVNCSFNTDIARVDNALMRKGRLIAKYEFRELETHKANLLSDKLGFAGDFTSPATLSAIYHQSEREFNQAKRLRQIGFKTALCYDN